MIVMSDDQLLELFKESFWPQMESQLLQLMKLTQP